MDSSRHPDGRGRVGTVEEIQRAIEEGKPVMVYFSNRAVVPDSLDRGEYERLLEFRNSLRSRALYREYEDVDHLARLLPDDVTRTVRDMLDRAIVGPRAHDDREGGEIAAVPAAADDASAGDVAQPDREVPRRGTSISRLVRWQRNAEVASTTARRLRDDALTFGVRWRALREASRGEESRALAGEIIDVADNARQQLVSIEGDARVEAAIEELRHVIAVGTRLQHHRFYIDGGASWNAFTKDLDAMVGKLRTVAEQLEAIGR